MLAIGRFRLLVLTLAVLGGGWNVASVSAAAPGAKWVGQDGKDFVGAEPGPGPNGYQDIHVVLAGLPAGRNLAEVEFKGHGRGAWNNQVTNKAAVHVVRGGKPGTFDLYLEPFERETGREFELKWKLDTGQTGGLYFAGGKADPNLRVAGLGIEAKWVNPGATGSAVHDRTNPGVGVGPDGVEDARITISKLAPKAEIKEVAVGLANGSTWRSGLNPQGGPSAEFVRQRDDPTRGALYFSPSAEIVEQQPLKLTVTYHDDRTDSASVVVGKRPGSIPLAPPKLANVAESVGKARWVGQGPADRGEVRAEVTGLPADKTIVAAALSDGAVSTWRFRRDDAVKFDAGPDPLQLRLARPASGKLELRFAPTRDEAGTTMTLRLLDASGREEVLRFAGGSVDFARLCPPLPAGSIRVKPGDDLPALAERGGTLTLAPGTYNLTRPLVLSRPVKIVGPRATLRFTQTGGKPWGSAIEIHSGGTTLEGFAVRCAGPIRWDRGVDHGPAVIASTEHRPDGDSCHQVALVNLDLEAPAASSDWEEALNLVRFLSASSGRVEHCTLKGGTVLVGGGPWSIAENEYRGALPQTYSQGVFAALYPHDLTLARNQAHDVGLSGKTWRFLVLAQRGVNDRIIDNVIDGGIGPHQADPHPHQNAPELILTEAYRLHYEGKPAAISPDGRTLAIHTPQGGPASTGDAVALLTGSQAGQYRTIAQPLGPQTYLLDEPIALDTTAVSLATGFVRESFERNTIDCRGSTLAAPLVLAGNLFGVRVIGNQLYGGGESLRLHASPTEAPVHWGWSHAPFLGGTIADNLIADPLGGPAFGVGVEHGPPIKTNQGRIYMSLTFTNNTFRWTKPGTPPRVNIGYAPTLDPAELIITEQGTKLEGAPASTLWVSGAQINGAVVRNSPLKPSP